MRRLMHVINKRLLEQTIQHIATTGVDASLSNMGEAQLQFDYGCQTLADMSLLDLL
jgi:hypothetical protein